MADPYAMTRQDALRQLREEGYHVFTDKEYEAMLKRLDETLAALRSAHGDGIV